MPFPLFCTFVLLVSEMATFDEELSSLFPSEVGGSRGKKQTVLAEETFMFTVFMLTK